MGSTLRVVGGDCVLDVVTLIMERVTRYMRDVVGVLLNDESVLLVLW